MDEPGCVFNSASKNKKSMISVFGSKKTAGYATGYIYLPHIPPFIFIAQITVTAGICPAVLFDP